MGASSSCLNGEIEGALVIWQINLKASRIRAKYLVNLTKNKYPNGPPHVIAIQDPPKELPWISTGNYKPVYRTARTLREEDHPYIPCKPTKKAKYEQRQLVDLDPVAFLVLDTIPVGHWHPTFHEDLDADPRDFQDRLDRLDPPMPRHEDAFAATLALSTLAGPINIHNVYNRQTKINIDRLLATCTLGQDNLLLGDFNLHHPRWSRIPFVGPITSDARSLFHGTEQAGMECITEPGAMTYSRGSDKEKHTSTIDLAFLSQSLLHRFTDWSILEGGNFDSDHRIIQTTLLMEPDRTSSDRYLWGKADVAGFRAHVERELANSGLLDTALMSKPDINAYFSKFNDIIRLAIPLHVPLAKHPVIRRSAKPPPLRDKQHPNFEQQASTRLGTDLDAEQDFDSFCRRLEQQTRTEKTKKWRTMLSGEGDDSPTIHKRAKIGAFLSKPRVSGQIPFLVGSDKTKCTSLEENAQCLRKSVWPNTSQGPTAPPLQLPDLDPLQPQLFADQVVSDDDVKAVLSGLTRGKAAGPDGVSPDALKMLYHPFDELPDEAVYGGGYEALRDSVNSIIHPYIKRGAQACLLHSYHPDAFKPSITVILPKLNKDDYTSPKAYRPVALLSVVGKLIERIVANRLKKLALEHSDLIPSTQFGLPGKSTTKALEHLVNLVQQCWSPIGRAKLKATLMTIDITGAYDHVRRFELLKILRQKGVPDWIVRFVWSFLSDRKTVLKLPGHTSEEFWVDIGIPQGSPLSPILFLFFSSPILEALQVSCPFASFALAMSYVDDTNILVTSPSEARNCEALKFLYDNLVRWASPNGIFFGPHKTFVMHFRKSGSHGPPSTELPDIPGLSKNCLQTELLLLGVVVDSKLTWAAHIEQVITKVRRRMIHLRRISGSTWGPSLHEMKKLYVSSVLPIFSYACPVWFVDGRGQKIRGQLTKTLVQSLDAEQARFLRFIAGGFEASASEVVHKELHMIQLSVYLEQLALRHRINNLYSPEYRDLEAMWDNVFTDIATEQELGAHPYKALYGQAESLWLEMRERVLDKQLCRANWNPEQAVQSEAEGWADPKRRKAIIKAYLKDISMERSSLAWDRYRNDRSGKVRNINRNTPALKENWGPESLKYYQGLTRAQSSMLFQCRSGVIGLNGYLFSLKANLVETHRCRCGHPMQTAEHLFAHCKQLTFERSRLRKHVGVINFDLLVTTEANVATAWAIRHFDIAQFRWTGKHMPLPC
ncbi:zinc knuckle [Colletotrichum abscissum]|uniref:Zinc knuckle n=1 Tax=Colletotrichum abscissum TaxID=1671311 RepID=A0A9Q0AXM9_9PEZI|nr:zinc knuckle [Colletotrichum abscissum]